MLEIEIVGSFNLKNKENDLRLIEDDINNINSIMERSLHNIHTDLTDFIHLYTNPVDNTESLNRVIQIPKFYF